MPRFGHHCSVALIVLSLLHGRSASGADSSNVFTEYSITSWGLNEGVPDAAVYALAQDANGYLWLGTETGLYRFDGTRFLLWTALGARAAEPTQALHVARDGTLWVGFGGRGGVTSLHGGAA